VREHGGSGSGHTGGALNPAGIILKSNPAAAAGPEGAAGHYFKRGKHSLKFFPLYLQ